MSDLKVVPFQKPSHHNLDNDQVIRLLKQALERAENGGCHGVAVILLDDEVTRLIAGITVDAPM